MYDLKIKTALLFVLVLFAVQCSSIESTNPDGSSQSTSEETPAFSQNDLLNFMTTTLYYGDAIGFTIDFSDSSLADYIFELETDSNDSFWLRIYGTTADGIDYYEDFYIYAQDINDGNLDSRLESVSGTSDDTDMIAEIDLDSEYFSVENNIGMTLKYHDIDISDSGATISSTLLIESDLLVTDSTPGVVRN